MSRTEGARIRTPSSRQAIVCRVVPVDVPEPFLDLPAESIERQKGIGLWYEGDDLRVRGHLRDRYAEPDGGHTVMHEYRLDLWVSRSRMEVTRIEVDAVALPYDECFDASAFVQRLVGLRLVRGFTSEAMERLGGECACTHLNALISDLAIAGLFHGYLGVRSYAREHGRLPEMPPNDERTGICSGWRAGGQLATSMAEGRGIAPSRIYPVAVGPDPAGPGPAGTAHEAGHA